MATHDGRRAAADFEALPRRLGAGQSVMCDELAEVMLLAFLAHAAIRDPNAFSMKIHGAGRGLVHLFFRTRSREQRPVHESDGGLAGGAQESARETRWRPCRPRRQKRCHCRDERLQARFDASGANHRRWRLRFADRGAKAPCTSSHSAATARHKLCADPRIPRRSRTVRSRPPAPKPCPCARRPSDRRRRRTTHGRSRCENNCREPRDAERDKVAHPEPEWPPGLRTPSTSFGLPACGSIIMPIRFQLEVRHRLSPLSRHAIMASMTRLVSCGSRTSMDTTPACFAG